MFQGILSETQGQNLVLAVLIVPYSLDRGVYLVKACEPKRRGPSFFFFFFTLVTGPSRSLSLKLSETKVYEPQIFAFDTEPQPLVRVPGCPGLWSWN